MILNICSHCQQQNRPVANYCKKCGKVLVKSTPITTTHPPLGLQAGLVWQELVGLDNLKERFQNKLTVARNMKLADRDFDPRQFHTVLIGHTGSGKSKIVEVLTKALFQHQIITQPKPHVVTAADFGEYARNLSTNMAGLKGSVLFIDNAQQLVRNNQANLLDKLYHEMDKTYGNPIVMLAARPDDFQAYLTDHQEISGRFANVFHLPEYTIEQMMAVAEAHMALRHYQTSPDFLDKLKKRFVYLFRGQFDKAGATDSARNGFLVEKEISRIEQTHFMNPAFQQQPATLLPDDIRGELFETKSVAEIMAELDDLVGMSEVKTFVNNLIEQVALQRRDTQLTGRNLNVEVHVILTGNPGTGKTTLARKLGEIFAAAGVLSSGHVVEVDRSKLVGQYVGQTPLLVQQYCDEAQGGVLFVDEAYTLKQDDNDKVGQEAIETLLKRMEDDRGKFVMIAAGYQKEMQNFITANPGMKSRVTHVFHLPDYTPPQLLDILKVFVKQSGYALSTEAEEKAARALKELHDRRDDKFGNARDVRNFFATILSRRAERLQAGGPHDTMLQAEDVPGDRPELTADSLDAILADLNSLIGLRGVKQAVQRMADAMEAERLRVEAGGPRLRVNRHVMFRGNPGTGKTTVARLLGKVYKHLGILPTDTFIEVDAKDLIAPYMGQSAPQTNKVIDRAMGGVLFIDEAYALNPKYSQNSGAAQEVVDTLLVRMENDFGKFIVIGAGYPKEMNDLRLANPGLDSRFPLANEILFEDYTPDELHQILLSLVQGADMRLEPEASQKARRLMADLYRMKTDGFGNAREVRNQFQIIMDRQSQRFLLEHRVGEAADPMLIKAADIPGGELVNVTNLMQELDSLVGLTSVKQQLRSLVNYLEVETEKAEAGGDKTTLNIHFVFRGNPGTGKTTVARLVGNILKGIGLLPKGQLIEVTDKDLVAPYVGQTAPKTNAVINSAMGGVLFIDEAYTLTPKASGNSFGQEAIDTLLKRMEDDKGKFVVIAAGYSDKMAEFVDSNPGFQSRFAKYIDFEDYTPDEMRQIFLSMCRSKSMKLAEGFEESVGALMDETYRRRDKNFANARTVRNQFEQMLQRQADRIARHKNNQETYNPLLFTPDDLPDTRLTKPVSVEDALQELNSLIGLQRVKAEVKGLINYLKVEKMRAERGGKSTALNLHFVFTGSPGTGKTTVARILAKILKALEILPEGHLVETARKDLVGQYIGETAPKTTKVIDSAMGGVLFIDEAYALMPAGNTNDFGKEAIDTLLIRMENDRGRFVVIAAGYSRDMNRFLAGNEGLPSRFTRTIEFDDYTPEEMAQIFLGMVEAKGMVFVESSGPTLVSYFDHLYQHRDSSFANGRTVRNVFEKALQKQADRMAVLAERVDTLDNHLLDEIYIEDLP
jgi:SpoVK/Ycf46/Vps4 family AAA+-type ATPase